MSKQESDKWWWEDFSISRIDLLQTYSRQEAQFYTKIEGRESKDMQGDK